jgi:ureidoglycolate lyase
MSETIATTYTVQTQPLTPEAFAPFGVILSPQGRERLPINTYGDKLDLYRESFASDQPIEWFIVQGRVRDMQALFLERHSQITQTFIPLNGDGFVMLVAKHDAAETNSLVHHEELQAFVIPGDTAVQLHCNTWHENPFPLKDNQTFLVTSHQALTRGHQQNPDASLAQLPLDLERRWYKDHGTEVRVDVS